MGSLSASSDQNVIHATTVAHAGHAAVIRGRAGSGKSGLALQMIALGARLVTDDRTILTLTDDRLISNAPEGISGQIEARGVGILAAPIAGATQVALVVDMDESETKRLPPLRETRLLGITLPLLRKVDLPHFPAAVLAYLEHGRIA